MRFNTWQAFLAAQATFFGELRDFVRAERAAGAVYPPTEDVFRFTETPLRAVKVVILGQDPYHQPGQAHGLAFSVPAGKILPPSLRNIYSELVHDLGGDVLRHRAARERVKSIDYCSGDLTPWTQQGVLLLNTALTVRHGCPGSHLEQWRPFTDEVIRAVVDNAEAAPHFILWGANARMCLERVCGRLVPWQSVAGAWRIGKRRGDGYAATATYSSHPSPHSADRGFFGSRPFSRANAVLVARGVAPVDWRLP